MGEAPGDRLTALTQNLALARLLMALGCLRVLLTPFFFGASTSSLFDPARLAAGLALVSAVLALVGHAALSRAVATGEDRVTGRLSPARLSLVISAVLLFVSLAEVLLEGSRSAFVGEMAIF